MKLPTTKGNKKRDKMGGKLGNKQDDKLGNKLGNKENKPREGGSAHIKHHINAFLYIHSKYM
jgi:hypothetical protein